MPSHPPSAQDLAHRIIDAETGTTALHQAAEEGTLKDICGVTAELLATAKNDYGRTPLHVDAGPVPQGPALFSSNPRANTRA